MNPAPEIEIISAFDSDMVLKPANKIEDTIKEPRRILLLFWLFALLNIFYLHLYFNLFADGSLQRHELHLRSVLAATLEIGSVVFVVIFFNIFFRRTLMRMNAILGAALAALFITPASAGTIFGSKLNHEPTPPETCNADFPGDMCSWVLTTAQQNVGHERAPKTGTIAKIRLRSCTPGSFVLQLANAVPSEDKAKANRSGPAINYKGSARNCNGGTFIETFNVNVPVRKGEYLSVIASTVGFIYNSSGDGSLVFDPLLPDGGPFRTTTSTGLGSGILLLQAEYAN